MKKNIIIFGSGAFSRVLFSEIIKFKKYNFLGFVDDYSEKGKIIVNYMNKSYFNLGKIENVLKENSIDNFFGIVGVGFNFYREKIVNQVLKVDKKFKWESIISKDCILNANVTIGKGSIILSGVVINTHVSIGSHCIINSSSSIGHDNIFKDFSSCGPGVITGGNVTIGENSHLGIGCIIKNGIAIGKKSVIGGNSFVDKDCLSNYVYYGIPAKKNKKRKINENYLK